MCRLYQVNRWYSLVRKTHIRGRIAMSTLAAANEKRNWRIYQGFVHVLIHQTRKIKGASLFIRKQYIFYKSNNLTITKSPEFRILQQFRRTFPVGTANQAQRSACETGSIYRLEHLRTHTCCRFRQA